MVVCLPYKVFDLMFFHTDTFFLNFLDIRLIFHISFSNFEFNNNIFFSIYNTACIIVTNFLAIMKTTFIWLCTNSFTLPFWLGTQNLFFLFFALTKLNTSLFTVSTIFLILEYNNFILFIFNMQLNKHYGIFFRINVVCMVITYCRLCYTTKVY